MPDPNDRFQKRSADGSVLPSEGRRLTWLEGARHAHEHDWVKTVQAILKIVVDANTIIALIFTAVLWLVFHWHTIFPLQPPNGMTREQAMPGEYLQRLFNDSALERKREKWVGLGNGLCARADAAASVTPPSCPNIGDAATIR